MNHAIKLLQRRREELTDGLWSIAEQQRNISGLRDGVERAEANLVEAELELEQIDEALRALAVRS